MSIRDMLLAGILFPSAGGGGGVTDHGALTGLSDDDHTGYAKNAGATRVLIDTTGLADGYILAYDQASGKFLPVANATSDEIIEVADYAALPGTGALNKIYITLDDEKLFRWTGTVYSEASPQTIPDHGTLSGLSDDDHTQYVKDAGTPTDNALVRFDGTTGRDIQNSLVIVEDLGELYGFKGKINAQTGTTYEILTTDAGKVISLSNAAAITCTVSNDLPADFCCSVIQKGAGQITFVAESGGTRRNRQSHTKSAGQYAMCSIYVLTNSGGTAAEFILGGDTAT